MKYRVLKTSQTGQALNALLAEMKAVKRACSDWLREKGYPQTVARDSICVAGGIAGIEFADKPEGWKLVLEDGKKKYYYPIEGRKASRAVLAELRALPRVRVFEWNDAIGWDGFLNRYGLIEQGDCYLLNVPEPPDTAAPEGPGLEEITSAEYSRLLGTEAEIA